MTKVDIVFAIILLVAAVFLTIAVLMQSGKSHNLSGTIAGGADTFFGKTKGKTIDRVLSKLTTVVAIVFALLVIVVYVIQDDNVVTKDNYIDDYINSIDETAAETTAAEDIAETTVAETSSVDAADTTAAE
ncbi:MAG: preprotein translocase subunit SecG [Oscillospiraceae bacterium]|jgi:preprotein translocase, secG subunit|nr:MAG: preprotein translocase subunit SecG [Oscillospiraceae bacterium]